MLQTAYTALLALKSEGLTAEEAIMRQPLAELDAQWSGGLFSTYKWIGLVYPAVN